MFVKHGKHVCVIGIFQNSGTSFHVFQAHESCAVTLVYPRHGSCEDRLSVCIGFVIVHKVIRQVLNKEKADNGVERSIGDKGGQRTLLAWKSRILGRRGELIAAQLFKFCEFFLFVFFLRQCDFFLCKHFASAFKGSYCAWRFKGEIFGSFFFGVIFLNGVILLDQRLHIVFGEIVFCILVGRNFCRLFRAEFFKNFIGGILQGIEKSFVFRIILCGVCFKSIAGFFDECVDFIFDFFRYERNVRLIGE